jgi:hypothetical protein
MGGPESRDPGLVSSQLWRKPGVLSKRKLMVPTTRYISKKHSITFIERLPVELTQMICEFVPFADKLALCAAALQVYSLKQVAATLGGLGHDRMLLNRYDDDAWDVMYGMTKGNTLESETCKYCGIFDYLHVI